MPPRHGAGHAQPCHWCGRTMIAGFGVHPAHPLRATRDHVIPIAAYGGDDAGNIVWCCRACNAVKANMRPAEWDAFRANVPQWWDLYRGR